MKQKFFSILTMVLIPSLFFAQTSEGSISNSINAIFEPIVENMSKVSEVLKQSNEEDKDVDKKPSENVRFRVEEKDNKQIFICNTCNYEGATVGAVRSHITKKHREKPADSEDE